MAKILNLARLDRKLKRLPTVARVRIRLGMEEAADEIVAMMKSLVPKDSGTLRDSIGWTWGKAPKGSMVMATAKGSLGADLTLTIYAGNSDAYYARWVEFGTVGHTNAGKFAGSDNPGTRAQPFFYVSWRANKRAAKRIVRKASRDAAKKVAAG
ncbi:HK97 gp10 family phage protein [Neorhizobium sp. IRS_2294]|uniref:HK97 gp10 family phage protein n=1 Tax=unclassified Neorhizobium TaxID=2629175 RepID=UPI003D2945BE